MLFSTFKKSQAKIKFLSAIRQGLPVPSACFLAGLHPETVLRWQKRGEREGEGEYYDFYIEVSQAIAMNEASLVADLQNHAKGNRQAAAWLLERKLQDNWGKKTTAETVNGLTLDITLSIPYGKTF